jgi:PAS domain S-box-containing protein
VTRKASGDGTAGADSLIGDAALSRVAVAHEHFRLLVESVKDYAIFMLDPSGHVASWNAGARLIKGYSPDEIVGKHMSTFYSPEDRAAQRPQKLLEIATLEGRVEDEGWRLRKDGSRFWADVIITALRDEAGRLVGFGKVTRDLTARREVEERLRDAEERLATTLRSIGDGVLATNENARVTIINGVAQQLTGWSEREAIGAAVEDVFHIVNEETRAKVANPIARVLKEGIVVGLANHTLLIARDGTERPIADSGAPIRDEKADIRGAVLIFRDVTQERRAEEALRQSEARLRLMITSVRDYAIFMLDPNGRVVTWNSGAERIKGYQGEEIIGQDFSMFFTPEDIAAAKPQRELKISAQEGRFEDEAWRVRKDGSRFWANVIISAVRDASGTLIGFTKVTRDLTARRRMEEERIRLAQAEEAMRLRDDFLSIASHELKTPLTALQLQLQGLLDRKQSLDEKVARKLEKAARAGDRLGDLVESLLDVSRIASGHLSLKYEAFDMVEVAHEVIARLREAAQHARCDVSLGAGAPVRGLWDRLRVEQILTSLLSNAFKYAAATPVLVTIRRETDMAVLQVRDAGPGLPETDLPRLFRRFERGSSPSYGGFGLGLYVVRQVADAHGGTITAVNNDGPGASITVRLPLEPAEARTPSVRVQ